MLGRGLRTYPGKESCAIVDFVDVMAYNKGNVLASPATLLGLPQEYAVPHSDSTSSSETTAVTEFESRLDPMIMQDVKITFNIFKQDYLDQLEHDSDVLRSCSSLAWVRIAESDFVLTLPDHKTSILIRKLQDTQPNTWESYINRRIKTPAGGYIQRKEFAAKHAALEPAFRGWDAWVRGKYGKRVCPVADMTI